MKRRQTRLVRVYLPESLVELLDAMAVESFRTRAGLVAAVLTRWAEDPTPLAEPGTPVPDAIRETAEGRRAILEGARAALLRAGRRRTRDEVLGDYLVGLGGGG